MQKQIEQTLDSREVAEMIGKEHKNLMRDVRGYAAELNQLKIEPVEFFRENEYKDGKGERRPCYDITKKGCEFIAHKLTGIRGTEFTARYINRFHDMEDTIREGAPKQPTKKKKNLSATNMLVRNISTIFKDAGVNPTFIAAEAKRIYKEQADIEIQIPLITDSTTQSLWDCTSIARELGIFSKSGRPHDKAVSAIIQKLDIFTNEIVRTAYSRNGHDGVTVQYKHSVLEKAKEWLEENHYPTAIEFRLSNGDITVCKVVYQEVA